MNKQTQINILYCDQSVKNTGQVACALMPKAIVGHLVVRRDTILTKAMALAWKATIAGWLAEDDPKKRAHLILNFEGMESKNTEAKYRETPYGSTRKVSDGKYGRRFEYEDGGLAMHTKLKTFDGKQDLYDIFEIDKDNNGFHGVTVKGGLKGYKVDMIDVPNYDHDNKTDPTKFYWQVAFADPDEFNKRPGFLKLPDDVSIVDEFASLIDTELAVDVDMDATGLVGLRFTIGNGAINLGDDYSATLADQSLYTATNVDNGADLDVDSVQWDAATGNVNVQLDATDPDFPASGANIRIDYGPASAIATALMPGHSEASVVAVLG